MPELNEEDRVMLVEILQRAGIQARVVKCEFDRCVCNDGGTCDAEGDIEMSEEGVCVSFVPKW